MRRSQQDVLPPRGPDERRGRAPQSEGEEERDVAVERANEGWGREAPPLSMAKRVTLTAALAGAIVGMLQTEGTPPFGATSRSCRLPSPTGTRSPPSH
jgi:hypothetical protein